MNDLYRQEILNHYRFPQNMGKPSFYTHSASLANSHCGDEITVYLVVKEEIVEKIFYEVKGCAICTASASILSDKLKGLTKSKILLVKGNKVLKILKIKPTPIRAQCAFLPLETIKQALITAFAI